jgi:ATP-dependent DNA helicase RecG
MTATPIPRSSASRFTGTDISSIAHSPEGRGTIRTFIRKRDKLAAVWEFVKKRLAEGRQRM